MPRTPSKDDDSRKPRHHDAAGLPAEPHESRDFNADLHRLLITMSDTTPSEVSEDGDVGARSPAMRRVWRLAARVATVDSTVLITGESGVGKERVARFLHDASLRAAGPFVPVNCGAIGDTLLETELFGHAKGAFTGALQERAGLFEAAHGGTLFLDEIGEVSPAMQVKLLRVIQEREVRRVGENKMRRVNIRLVAATNRNLLTEVTERRFRQDLYYRLSVIDLHIPPLRERPEDLRALAHDLLTRAARQMRRPLVGYTARAWDRVLQYAWPGNIRELQHAIERACTVASGVCVDVDDLPELVRHPPPLQASATEVRPLWELERDYILAALKHNQGSRRRTAEQLQIAPATVTRKLRGYRRRR